MNKLVYQSKRFFKRNGSTILTCLGGAGAVATTIMAVKATPKALSLIEQAKEEKGEDLTNMEIVQVAGPSYIPTIAVGIGSLACIFGANMLNKQKQAALTSAYAYLNSSFNEYKDKVKAIYGEDGEKRVREEIAKDKYIQQSMPESSEEMLFFEEYSGRYFECTLFDLQNAMYKLNRLFALEGYVNLNDFYDYVGLPPAEVGAVLGWSGLKCWEVCNKAWIDIKWDDMELPDGVVAQAIRFPISPSDDYEEW